MRILTFAAITAAFVARNPTSGVLDSVAASGEGTIDAVQAQAVRGFGQVTGKLLWVKATEHFFEAGEIVKIDDFVQMREQDANQVVSAGRAVFATDAQVAAAQATA